MTSLESLVPSLDLCRQLQAAGFPQDTAMCWVDDRRTYGGERFSPNVQIAYNCTGIECEECTVVAAPTAEEILGELPWTIQPWPPTAENAFLQAVKTPDGFRVHWFTWDNKHEVPLDDNDKHYEKESEAAALAYLWWKKEVAG